MMQSQPAQGSAGLSDSNRPKVSVCVITYNHAKYIGECLRSILEQQTKFEFEIIVGDDGSTDGTRGVIESLAALHPGRIRALLHDPHIGGTKNMMAVHNEARGKYVAHLDGDDLALPGKLQAQADYLDLHDDCALVWHRMLLFDDANTYCHPNLLELGMFEDGKVRLEDTLMFGSLAYHSSVMYRRETRRTREVQREMLDWYFTVEHLQSGYGKYLEDILGKYRRNSHTGITRKGKGPDLVRSCYADHLEYFLDTLPQYRKELFINSVLYLMVNIKNGYWTAWRFLWLAMRAISMVTPLEFLREYRRFRRINAGR